jgi:hypothetical protein
MVLAIPQWWNYGNCPLKCVNRNTRLSLPFGGPLLFVSSIGQTLKRPIPSQTAYFRGGKFAFNQIFGGHLDDDLSQAGTGQTCGKDISLQTHSIF